MQKSFIFFIPGILGIVLAVAYAQIDTSRLNIANPSKYTLNYSDHNIHLVVTLSVSLISMGILILCSYIGEHCNEPKMRYL